MKYIIIGFEYDDPSRSFLYAGINANFILNQVNDFDECIKFNYLHDANCVLRGLKTNFDEFYWYILMFE